VPGSQVWASGLDLLPHIHAGNQAYVGTEMSSFPVAWLMIMHQTKVSYALK
jgi:hypothetical protein